MGKVFLSEDPVLQRQVAIKVISLDHSIDENTRKEFLQRFAFEAQASARLSHPSIVTIYDAGEQENIPWIAFEFINGESLEQLLQREKKLSYEKIRSIIIQIASALDHAHQHQIIHRDIKPANILIDLKTGVAKLSDFGVVKAPWAGLTQSGVTVGSPGYMSPEQIDGSDIDHRSDLFSLGVVLYQLIAGKHPFVKDSVPATIYATINQDYTPLKQLREDVPEDLDRAVTCLLKVSKDERPPSSLALISLIKNKSTENFSIKYDEKTSYSSTLKNRIIYFYNKHLKSIKHSDIEKTANSILIYFKKALSYARKKSSSSTYSLLRNKSFKLLILSSVILLLLFSLIHLLWNDNKVPDKTIPITVEKVPSIISTFDSLLSAGNLDSARILATGAIEHSHQSWSDLFLGRIELRSGNYYIADNHFKKVNQTKKAIIKLQMDAILDDLEKAIQKEKAPESLINLAVNTLEIANKKRSKEWLNNKNYWIRWNAVKIRQTAGKNIDMVNIYMLDLNSNSSMRTRIRAAEKLGEIGDKRAVPLLQEIGERGIRDPFVSASARNVLERYFNNKDSSIAD